MKLLLLLRSLVATVFFVLHTAVIASTIILLSFIVKRGPIFDHLMWVWARPILFFYNVHITVKGKENKPTGGVLYLFNHSSHFDILALASALSQPSRFGAKIELFKIPLFGRAMLALGVLPITRSEREKVLQLYEDSIKRVHAGESFILAAEGTRQPNPGVGSKFKGGPFIFAINGQFPIIPVVIRGAAECLPKGDLLACTRRFRHDVTIQLLPPLFTNGLKAEDRTQLRDQAQKIMTTAYLQG